MSEMRKLAIGIVAGLTVGALWCGITNDSVMTQREFVKFEEHIHEIYEEEYCVNYCKECNVRYYAECQCEYGSRYDYRVFIDENYDMIRKEQKNIRFKMEYELCNI